MHLYLNWCLAMIKSRENKLVTFLYITGSYHYICGNFHALLIPIANAYTKIGAYQGPVEEFRAPIQSKNPGPLQF